MMQCASQQIMQVNNTQQQHGFELETSESATQITNTLHHGFEPETMLTFSSKAWRTDMMTQYRLS